MTGTLLNLIPDKVIFAFWCIWCTYCRENSIYGSSCHHTALPPRGKRSRGMLHTCCLRPSLAWCFWQETQRWWERLNILSVPPLNFQTRVSKKKDSCVFCHIKALQDLYHNSNDLTENYSYRPQRLSQLHKQSQPWQKGRLIPRGMLAGAMPQSFCFLMSCGWRMQTLTAQKKWEINSVLSHHASP